MKKKFAHKPIEIIAFELTDNFEEITKMIDNLNEHFGYDRYEYSYVEKHNPSFLDIYDGRLNKYSTVLKGDYLFFDDDGTIHTFTREKFNDLYEPVKDDENS